MITEDDRRYPKRPLVGVGAIIFDGPRILMAQRGKAPLLGWWSLPGGALQAGDDVCRVEWAPRKDLAKLQITEGTLGVIEKAFRERRKYGSAGGLAAGGFPHAHKL